MQIDNEIRGIRTLDLVCMGLGWFLVLAGLVFTILSLGNPERLVVSLATLVGGGGLVWISIEGDRYLEKSDPDLQKPRVMKLAGRLQGELTLSQVVAGLEIGAETAERTLEAMVAERKCSIEYHNDQRVFVFAALQARMSRRCPYCGSDFTQVRTARECPVCHAALDDQA